MRYVVVGAQSEQPLRQYSAVFWDRRIGAPLSTQSLERILYYEPEQGGESKVQGIIGSAGQDRCRNQEGVVPSSSQKSHNSFCWVKIYSMDAETVALLDKLCLPEHIENMLR